MDTALSRLIWETRYRDTTGAQPETGIQDTWLRVARAAAAAEADGPRWADAFTAALRGFRFLPGGRILAGAATRRAVTLFNCFVMGAIDDSMLGIFDALKEGALTMQQGGGVGYDFSTLRPRGVRARTTGAIASGPVSFMRIWDTMCRTLLSTGARRGAMMGTLRCDHPDIEGFIDAKRDPLALRHFNLSVLVTDELMNAVRYGHDWPLVFPERALSDADAAGARCVERTWSGAAHPERCRIVRLVPARAIWDRIVATAHECAESGVLFIDRINQQNNLGYRENLSATNPCAEVPLPPYGGCNLGSLNLPAFVRDAFSADAALDFAELDHVATVATRFLDDIIEVSGFPLPQQRETIRSSRRIGLGITGLADALAMLRLRYDTEPARKLAARIMRTIRDAAYRTSVELARERGPFPALDATAYLDRPFVAALPAELRESIRRHGIRNSHLTAIAPAGTISLLADNVSSGVEPIRAPEIVRRVVTGDGTYRNFGADDFAFAVWRSQCPPGAELPDYFRLAHAIGGADQLAMLAALQPYVDNGISKTVTLKRDSTPSDVRRLLDLAFELDLKGCTIYREGSRETIFPQRKDLDPAREASGGAHCCPIDREAD
jgi:ribonucleoside-diphosphate reductase alpha chain